MSHYRTADSLWTQLYLTDLCPWCLVQDNKKSPPHTCVSGASPALSLFAAILKRWDFVLAL